MKKYLILSFLQMLIGQKRNRHYRHSPDDIFVYDKGGREIFRRNRGGYRSYGQLEKPKVFRYAKYAALALVLFVVTAGGLAVWGAISAFNFAADLAKQTPIAAQISQGEEKLRAALEKPTAVTIADSKAKLTELANRPLTTEACLNRLTGLLAPSNWLTVPLAAHWKNLKEACVTQGRGPDSLT